LIASFIEILPVNFLNETLFGFTAWRIYLAAALFLFFVGFVVWRVLVAKRGGGTATAGGKPAKLKKFADKVMSTIPLTDTQRIDRLQRVVSLKPGQHADLDDLTFGRLPKLRVAFRGIEHTKGQEFAHIKIELGGATASCGASVEEVGDNDFLVPRASGDDQRSAIHYMCGKSDAVSYLQVRVRKIDIAEGSASVDVLHVRGRKRAA
jgi:hypothetical protein